MKKIQKWSREEYKEILYCFYYPIENPSKNPPKKQREYVDANKLANVRRDVLHKN